MVLFTVLFPEVYDSFCSEIDYSYTQSNTNSNGVLLTGTVSLQVKTLYNSEQGDEHSFKRYSHLGLMSLLLRLIPSPFVFHRGEDRGYFSLPIFECLQTAL